MAPSPSAAVGPSQGSPHVENAEERHVLLRVVSTATPTDSSAHPPAGDPSSVPAPAWPAKIGMDVELDEDDAIANSATSATHDDNSDVI